MKSNSSLLLALTLYELNASLSFKSFSLIHKMWTKGQNLNDLDLEAPLKKKIIPSLSNLSWIQRQFLKFEKKLLFWKSQGIHVMDLLEDRYPQGWLQIKNPPLVLFYMGNPCWLNTDMLSIVGRRELRPHTQEWMNHQLPLYFNLKSKVIVSGGARGVDSVAHKLALVHGLKTIYILPSGLTNPYPHRLKGELHSLIKSGASFISSYWPDQIMHKSHFHFRNELIATLTPHTFIIEAEVRSGSMKTAHLALKYGNNIGILPSFPTDYGFSGSLQLIYDGAQMIRDYQDMITFFK